uniref:Uncharacterized protein n=1 Tax=Mycena chlorophos TaxID=658473 RepID=A0ABQ0LGV4_MYCCL|nr:predicted protein [Mycena chlorophos]
MADENRPPEPSRPLPVLSPSQRVFLDEILRELGCAPDPHANPGLQLGKRKDPPPRNAYVLLSSITLGLNTSRSNRGAFHQLIDAAKFTPRGADAFWNMRRILAYGCLAATDKENFQALPARERGPHHAQIFSKILQTCRYELSPVVHFLHADFARNPAPWSALVSRVILSIITLARLRFPQFGRAAQEARTQDTNTFKSHLRVFLPNPDTDYFVPPIESTSKARRGLTHPQLRLLIMPWRDRVHFPPLVFREHDSPAELSQDAQNILAQIAINKYEPSSKRFPSFCYPDGKWDPEQYQANLFRNVAIVRGLRLLLITRVDALGVAKNAIPSGCIAAIHSIYEVTPELVAYIVVQLRLSLSSLPEWKDRESPNYSLSDLYRKVLAAFDDTSNPNLPDWSQETLNWLTSQVFCKVEDPRAAPPEDDPDESEDEAVVQRKRRAEESG